MSESMKILNMNSQETSADVNNVGGINMNKFSKIKLNEIDYGPGPDVDTETFEMEEELSNGKEDGE